MKKRRVKTLEWILQKMAVSILEKHKPIIIGITGSVGKSSTKEAIAHVLGTAFDVRKNEGNYNNEIGVPLTIIGAESGKRSLFAWMRVAVQYMRVMRTKKYPQMLVLELGIDRPGDMSRFMEYLPVSVGVVTNISHSHLEYFQTIDAIAKEKSTLVKKLSANSTAILCADDARVMRNAPKLKCKVITYGEDDKALIKAEHITVSVGDTQDAGCYFKINYDGNNVPAHIPHCISRHHIQSLLAAFSVGVVFKLNPLDMINAFKTYSTLPGRMKLLSGISGTQLIDDTYNASPTSLKAALKSLMLFTKQRRVVILGDMLELGPDSEDLHRKVADMIVDAGVNSAMFVGRRMLVAYEALIASGFDARVCAWYESPLDAIENLRDFIQEGDVILIKGSQGMRMEKVSEALLAQSEKAETVLCRQSMDWKQKPFRVV